MADMTVEEALEHADYVAKRHDLADDSAYDFQVLLRLAAEVRKHQWIPVSERLPKFRDISPCRYVLALPKQDDLPAEVVPYHLVHKRLHTHWMPLPEPPTPPQEDA